MSSPLSELERFAAGEQLAVDPDEVERALVSVWREAGRSTAGRVPVTRACLWNVVALIDTRVDGPGCPGWLQEVLRHLPEHLAARALVLRAETERPGAPELRSWISANCILASGGGKLVCSEEVDLESRGEGWRHLPGLARALLVPGVPTAAVFGEVPSMDDPLPSALVQLADRVVTWAERCGSESPLALALRLGEVRSLVDLGWAARADLRAAVGALFAGAEADAARIETVEVTIPSEAEAAGRLLVGWVAERLGLGEELEGSLAGEGVRGQARHGRVVLRLRTGGEGRAVRFFGPGFTRAVVREPGGGLRLERPSGCRRWSRAEVGAPALLARALLHRSSDAELSRALSRAEGLP